MQPVIEPLSKQHRGFIFNTLLVLFVILVPILIFYAMGFRFSVIEDTPVILVTGGLYVTSDLADSAIFIDDKEITNARVFRKASYIQGLAPGLHRVSVQAPDYHTWVKELWVNQQRVVEMEAFNLPEVPHLRPVTKYLFAKVPVYLVATSSLATSTEEVAETEAVSIFATATSTIAYQVLSDKVATSTLEINEEFVLLEKLFAEKASTTAKLKEQEKEVREIEEGVFGFAATSEEVGVVATCVAPTALLKEGEEVATSTVIADKMMLYQEGDEVWARALGTGRQVPYYFCSNLVATTTGSYQYEIEEFVLDNDEAGLFLGDNNDTLATTGERSLNDNGCRTDIKIDRQSREVLDFQFFPTSNNLVLLLREDGLFVTEIDDRSWQNTQPVYYGESLEMVIYRGGIFVKDGEYIFEVITVLANNR